MKTSSRKAAASKYLNKLGASRRRINGGIGSTGEKWRNNQSAWHKHKAWHGVWRRRIGINNAATSIGIKISGGNDAHDGGNALK